MKFDIGEHVLVTSYGLEDEPAVVEEYDENDKEYWCVFDNGPKTERSWVGLAEEEVRLDPGWFNEDELTRKR